VTSVLVIVVYFATLTEVVVAKVVTVQLRDSGTSLILQEIVKSQFEEAVIVETFFIEIEILELYV
jgi:hypothetical protein